MKYDEKHSDPISQPKPISEMLGDKCHLANKYYATEFIKSQPWCHSKDKSQNLHDYF